MIHEINPNYKFSLSLASTITEGSLHQHFLKDHFSTLTNCEKHKSTSPFFTDLVLKALK